jgi:hypothetical protein
LCGAVRRRVGGGAAWGHFRYAYKCGTNHHRHDGLTDAPTSEGLPTTTSPDFSPHQAWLPTQCAAQHHQKAGGRSRGLDDTDSIAADNFNQRKCCQRQVHETTERPGLIIDDEYAQRHIAQASARHRQMSETWAGYGCKPGLRLKLAKCIYAMQIPSQSAQRPCLAVYRPRGK